MATPKINIISLSFARQINDSKTSANAEFTAGTENGKVLSALQRMEFINKAMFELINIYWKESGMDVKLLARMFPELVALRTGTTSSVGVYTIANPNLDFFQLIEVVADGKYAGVAPKHLYHASVSGAEQFRATADNPKAFEFGGAIYLLPAASFNTKGLSFTMIKQPLNPTTGAWLTQGGDYDSPFYDTWNQDIVQIAKKIFFEETGQLEG